MWVNGSMQHKVFWYLNCLMIYVFWLLLITANSSCKLFNFYHLSPKLRPHYRHTSAFDTVFWLVSGPREDTSAPSRGYCNAKFSWESPHQTHLLNRFPSSFTTYNDHQICHQICDPQVFTTFNIQQIC